MSRKPFHEKKKDELDANALFASKFGLDAKRERKPLRIWPLANRKNDKNDSMMKTLAALRSANVDVDDEGNVVLEGDLDNLPDGMRESLMKAVDQTNKRRSKDALDSKDEAMSMLEGYAMARGEAMKLEVGDIVERNARGVVQYKFPDGNQVATVIDQHEYRFISNGDGLTYYNGVIAVAINKKVVQCCPVDLAMYKKVTVKA